VCFYNLEVYMATFFNLTSLNGKNGFVVEPSYSYGYCNSIGGSITLIDINGDKISDVVIANTYTMASPAGPGAVYVIYGTTTPFNATFNLAALDGTNGFIITSQSQDSSAFGSEVADIGDINGDKINDLAIMGPGKGYSRQAFIIFGNKTWSQTFDVGSLNGKNGFAVEAGDEVLFVRKISTAGDFNSDGVSDVLVSAYSLGGYNEVLVLFGQTMPFSSIVSLSGFNFTISTNVLRQYLIGKSISKLGDVNQDGIDDIAVGAPNSDSGAGRAYVIYGQNTLSNGVLLEDLNSTTGFYIQGSSSNVGAVVSYLGDVNGDTLNDIGISDHQYEDTTPGSSYVVFGNRNFNNSVSLQSLDGDNGFVITQNISNNGYGAIIQGIGYYNNDSFPDIAISLPDVNITSTYIIYGQSLFSATYNISNLKGLNAEVIPSVGPGDMLGSSVAGFGDINGDNKTDIILGASGVMYHCGTMYAIFGT
jgi:hypothetical protein